MGAYFPYVSKERAGLTPHYDVYTNLLGFCAVDTSKTRKPEHSDGSVLSVREQGARRLDDVLRHIYGCKKIKGFKETLKSLPQSKPLNSVSLLELINTSTGIN